MKKYTMILLISVFRILGVEAQDIKQLMQDYNNLYALENVELFTKPENEVNYEIYGELAPPKYHTSLKIINVETDWLQSITNIVIHDPTLLYPYLETETQNLAAYILLLHIVDIDMPKIGLGSQEITSLNLLKEDIFNPNLLPKFKQYKDTPTGEDPAKYVLNTIWQDVVAEGANTRIKAVVDTKCAQDSDGDGYNDCEDPNNAVNNTTITSNFTEDKGGWRNSGKVSTTLEDGRLKVSDVDSSWEGINRPLDALNIAPGQQLNISLDFDQGDTSANVRLYVQEQDAEGNHLSWNVINGKLQTRTYKYVYTIKAGYKAILRIDKDNTHLEETTHFYVGNVEVTKI